jgi:ABC-type sugar transport system permease subunit
MGREEWTGNRNGGGVGSVAVTSIGRTAITSRLSWWQRNQRRLAPYLFIAPFYVLFSIFFLGPVLFAFDLSLYDWNGIDPMRWLGLGNFADMLQDQTFLSALGNTATYGGFALFVIAPLALVLAVALNSGRVRGRAILRTVYFTPIVTSAVAIAIVFLTLYSTRAGLLNVALTSVGVPQIDWLGSPDWIKLAVVGLIAWRTTGFQSVYFLAGLQNIPQPVVEAAMVDGANRRQLFWHVTLPMLRPIIIFVAVITLIGSAQVFDEPYMLTRGSGGPLDSALSLANYLYRSGLQYVKLGYASAIGVAIFAIVFLLSSLQIRFFGVFRED